MKLLFEDYTYSTKDVKDILGFVVPEAAMTNDNQMLKCVGYFFNKNIENEDGTKGDLVFILPKVLLDEDNKAFGLEPLDLLNFNLKDWRKEEDKEKKVIEGGKLTRLNVYNFIYGFTTWIYRAVSLYRKNQSKKPKEEQDDNRAEVLTSIQVGKSGKKEEVTYMDILLSLLDFQQEHKDFITFVMKMAHSGFNKVSWSKTIARTQAVIQDGSPIYLNPINKERVINFDEELLIIYYSILNYIHEEYGFPIGPQPGYKLIKGAMFRSYMNGQGKLRLLKIRYKYYNDTAIHLWNLCKAFFDRADEIQGQANRKDFLLINKFETVFEAMIDELIGDKDLPAGLKVSGDDKRIDHLYTYKHLLENMEGQNEYLKNQAVYNIADSKYYKRDGGLRGHDVPKQFTYARNVIQWHMDLLHELLDKDVEKAREYPPIPLFDDVTEGYNVIPNFFISAQVDDELNYDKAGFGRSTLGGVHRDEDGTIPWVDNKNLHQSYFFWERLFDRNTYFTLHYDVNFLYVLKMYAKNKSQDKSTWKKKVRDEFRKDILKYLNDEFLFYQIMIPEDEIDSFVERHYRKIAGKVFSFEVEKAGRVLLYAERKTQPNGNGKSYTYDENKEPHIEHDLLLIPQRGKREVYSVEKCSLGESLYKKVRKLEELALFAYYKDQKQLTMIESNGIYNIRANGSGPKICYAQLGASYLFLHHENLGNRSYRITGEVPYLLKKNEFPLGTYRPSHDEYVVYDIVQDDEVAPLLEALARTSRFATQSRTKKPIIINLAKLRALSRSVPARDFASLLEQHIDRIAADRIELLYGDS